MRDVLRELNRSLSKLYASEGRPSIPPKQLVSALLLFYAVRSERQLMEQLDYKYRWYGGIGNMSGPRNNPSNPKRRVVERS